MMLPTWVSHCPVCSVYPSGLARASRPTPIEPPAPPTFSTITGWPSAAPILSAMIRAATSVDPPGGNGTISVIGREGKLSARVGASGAIEVSAINANATVATNLCMIPALTQRNRSGSILQMRIIHQTIRKQFRGRWTTKDNPTERTRDREATMTSRYFYTCGAAIAAGVMMSIAPHDRAAADDCTAPQPVSFVLAAKGSSTNVDYKKAFLDANTALDADFLTQKLALQKASACPEKCSWGDFYPDPLNSPRNYTVKPS